MYLTPRTIMHNKKAKIKRRTAASQIAKMLWPGNRVLRTPTSNNHFENSPEDGAHQWSWCFSCQYTGEGLSRLKIKSNGNSFWVILTPSVVIPKKFHGKFGICFRRNSSLGLCQYA